MIKKYSKLLLVFFCAFFVSITPSFAREVTLDELNDLVKETLDYSDGVSGIYIIGEYAYTSEWVLTTQDTMLAARTIKTVATGKTNKDEIYGAMTIHSYTRTTDSNYDYNGFKADPNLVGTTKSPDVVNIKYIDYVYIPDVSKAEIGSANDSATAYDEIKNAFGFDFENDAKLTYKDGKLTGEIYKNDAINEKFSSDPADATGYYYAFTVKVENATEDTIVKITGAKTKEFKGTDVFAPNGELVVLQALRPDAENKQIVVTVDLDGDGEEYGETKYIIDYSELTFKTVLDVNETLNKNLNGVSNDDYAVTVAGNKISLDLKDAPEKLNATDESALLAAITKVLNTEGVASIKLTYDGTEYVIDGKDATADSEQIQKLLGSMAGKDFDKALQNDIIGKNLTMTVQLEKGNVTTETPDGKDSATYEVEFTGTKAKDTNIDVTLFTKDSAVNSDALQASLKDLFNISENAGKLTLKDGKLTGTVDYITGVKGFPDKELTGYYFMYVLGLEEDVKDTTTVTLPGDGSVKVVGKDSFDSAREMVVVFSLDPSKTASEKVFEITVDLDGDGKEYLPTTYVIDYSELVFAGQVLVDAEQNLDKVDSVKNKTTFTTAAQGTNDAGETVTEKLVFGIDADIDFKSDSNYQITSVQLGDQTEVIYAYSIVENGKMYIYSSEDGNKWQYMVEDYQEDTNVGDSKVYDGYKSIKVVDSDIAGTTKLEAIVDKSVLEGEYQGDINDIVDDVTMHVYVKDGQIVKIFVDFLPSLSESAKKGVTECTLVNEFSNFNGASVTIPAEIRANAELVTE